jgi:hypothetical protein
MRHRPTSSFVLNVLAAAIAAALLVVVLDRFPGGGRLLIELVRELTPLLALACKKIWIGSGCQL